MDCRLTLGQGISWLNSYVTSNSDPAPWGYLCTVAQITSRGPFAVFDRELNAIPYQGSRVHAFSQKEPNPLERYLQKVLVLYALGPPWPSPPPPIPSDAGFVGALCTPLLTQLCGSIYFLFIWERGKVLKVFGNDSDKSIIFTKTLLIL
jgi:hypothetical protein